MISTPPSGPIPFWRTILAVVSFESRIALRTWRFWLLFGLLVVLSENVIRRGFACLGRIIAL